MYLSPVSLSNPLLHLYSFITDASLITTSPQIPDVIFIASELITISSLSEVLISITAAVFSMFLSIITVLVHRESSSFRKCLIIFLMRVELKKSLYFLQKNSSKVFYGYDDVGKIYLL